MADSPALYWKAQPTSAIGISFAEALDVTKQIMQKAGLTDIKKSASDVSGRTAHSHAAVTFLKVGDSYTAIIMAAGSEAKQVRDKLSDALNKITWL